MSLWNKLKRKSPRGLHDLLGSPSLSTLEGPEDYGAWATIMKDNLQRKGVWNIIQDPASTPTHKDHESIALEEILRSLKDLSWYTAEMRAKTVWDTLALSYGCPVCIAMGKKLQKTVQVNQLLKAADHGCSSCKLIWDSIEFLATGWADKSQLKLVSLTTESPCVIITLKDRTSKAEWRVRVFELLVSQGHQDCIPILESGTELIYQKRFHDSSFGYAIDWLDTCVSHHAGCSTPDPYFKPKRLIDVSLSGLHPCLKETAYYTDDMETPYAALSYCWGPVKGTLVTNTGNIKEHYKQIPIASMPQTIQDAVVVCRKLRIQYLWVDALCIIQDDGDEQDWYEESGRMRHIYSNAHLTIAADASPDSESGFLRKDLDTTLWPQFFPICTKDHAQFECRILERSLIGKHDPWPGIMMSPLSSRGWALQESILPNRILHYTDREVLWECNSGCRSKSGVVGQNQIKLLNRALRAATQGILKQSVPPIYSDDDEIHTSHLTDFMSQGSSDSVFWAWQLIVEHYTERQLTNQADKLSALSGLASLLVERLHINSDDYVAGLWKDDLARGLLWYVKGPNAPYRPSAYRAPSWSWASINGGVEYFKEHYQFRFDQYVVISNVCCTTNLSDPTGRIRAGRIVLVGSLVAVTLRLSTEVHKSEYTGKAGCASHAHGGQFIWAVSEAGAECEVLPDVRIDKNKILGENDYYCLEIGRTVDKTTSGSRVWWLLLQREIQSEGVYRRVGLGYRHTRTRLLDLFHEAERCTLTLI